MKPVIKNILIAVAAFIVLVALFSSLGTRGPEPQDVALSQVVERIEQGAVERLEVEGSTITAHLRDGGTVTSQKETEASLTESLTNLGLTTQQLSTVAIEVKGQSTKSAVLLTVLPLLIPFILIVAFFWFIYRQARGGQMQALNFGASQARLFSGDKEKITFEDVAGAEEAKEELKEVVEFLRSPGKFLRIGARIPRGVLLMGPPGTGKTLMARAVAGEAGVPFFHISGSEFVEMFVGVGASRVRDLFKTAKKSAPAIVFVDEIDAVGRHRGAGLGGGHDEREQTLNQILVELDGFDRDTNVIVMAATNRPDILDPALLRPGRFDRRVVIDEPDIKDREAILKIHAKEKKVETDVAFRVIAERTPGFSGADLANLVNEAALLAARRNKTKVSQQELAESIEKVMLGPERKSRLLSPKEKKIAAYHEAGHALVASLLPEVDPVHKVSIISRGRAGGYTLKIPKEETHFYSKTKFENELTVLLAGHAAEKIMFGEVTTGPSSDLKRASQLARSIVTEYGMSTKIGPVTFGEKEQLVFLGKELSENRNYSEDVASKIDKEISLFISKAHKKASSLIKKHKDHLEKIAGVLLEKETIEQNEFNSLIKGLKPSSA